LSVLVQFAHDGNVVPADGAIHVVCEVPLDDVEAIAFYNSCVAIRAVRVFAWVPGNVAQVNKI